MKSRAFASSVGGRAVQVLKENSEALINIIQQKL